MIPLFCKALVTSGMLGPVLGSLVQERHELNEVSSPKDPKDHLRTGDLSYKGRLREL